MERLPIFVMIAGGAVALTALASIPSALSIDVAVMPGLPEILEESRRIDLATFYALTAIDGLIFCVFGLMIYFLITLVSMGHLSGKARVLLKISNPSWYIILTMCTLLLAIFLSSRAVDRFSDFQQRGLDRVSNALDMIELEMDN